MTKEEAVAKLKSLGVRFRLGGGAVRDHKGRCPIVVIAESTTSKTYDNSEWAEAAQAIGISHEDAVELVGASDYAPLPVPVSPELLSKETLEELVRRRYLRDKLISLCEGGQ